MKAVLVARTSTSATVRLSPSWLGRLLGACESIVELVWHVEGRGEKVQRGWVVQGSRRWLHETPHGRRIENALDLVPVAAPPVAIVVREYTTSGCYLGADCAYPGCAEHGDQDRGPS